MEKEGVEEGKEEVGMEKEEVEEGKEVVGKRKEGWKWRKRRWEGR